MPTLKLYLTKSLSAVPFFCYFVLFAAILEDQEQNISTKKQLFSIK